MEFDQYQKEIQKFDFFDATDDLKSAGFTEKILGLVGEAGETADKVKKIIRDKNGIADPDDKDALKKELGDVLWYLATVARYLDIPLSEVANNNIAKLNSRQKRGKLHGEGDER